jgi:hypothetical protein
MTSNFKSILAVAALGVALLTCTAILTARANEEKGP